MVDKFQEIERQIWEEEKRFLMKQIGLMLVRNESIKFGDYTLTSGKKSPYYIDLRQTISSPITMDWISNSLVRIIINEIGRDKIDKILGVPTAGVPFATMVSQKLALPLIYYRKARKEHGVRKKIEGSVERNDRVLIVDDLITTGESVIEAAEAVREQGGIATELVVLLDREQGGSERLRRAYVEPHILFKVSEAFAWLTQVELLSQEEFEKITNYIEQEKIKRAQQEEP
ncbi:MAG: orotate phosphoribosyltransferase [Deltaproteobacteria bacterium]|nr:orotate phosphoribosyltransferase [Deltaproteobacteria bacterium]MBW2120331.1 orotate phosphoribosyltransferase [Deltaproteobacteria bacterium]